MLRTTAALLVALTALPLTAQTTIGVFPPRVTDNWGWKARDFPMGRTWCRTQVRVDSTMFPGNFKLPATVKAIGVRRATSRQTYKADVISQEIWFGATDATNATMTTNFATNKSNAKTGRVVVKRKTIILPPAGFGSPRDFLRIPFDGPAVFAGKHLLVEFSNTDTKQRLTGWQTDYVGTLGAGTRRYFGLPCATSGPTSVSSTGGTGGYTPGATLSFWSKGKARVPTQQVIGLDAVRWGAIPLPFDFTILGAPKCKLYVNAQVMVPFTRGANGDVTHRVPIPNQPSLANVQFNSQWVDFDRSANAAGLAFSEATMVAIGKVTGISSYRLVSTSDNKSVTGTGFNNEMPVLRLEY